MLDFALITFLLVIRKRGCP